MGGIPQFICGLDQTRCVGCKAGLGTVLSRRALEVLTPMRGTMKMKARMAEPNTLPSASFCVFSTFSESLSRVLRHQDSQWPNVFFLPLPPYTFRLDDTIWPFVPVISLKFPQSILLWKSYVDGSVYCLSQNLLCHRVSARCPLVLACLCHILAGKNKPYERCRALDPMNTCCAEFRRC